jgi:hypothetical protein
MPGVRLSDSPDPATPARSPVREPAERPRWSARPALVAPYHWVLTLVLAVTSRTAQAVVAFRNSVLTVVRAVTSRTVQAFVTLRRGMLTVVRGGAVRTSQVARTAAIRTRQAVALGHGLRLRMWRSSVAGLQAARTTTARTASGADGRTREFFGSLWRHAPVFPKARHALPLALMLIALGLAVTTLATWRASQFSPADDVAEPLAIGLVPVAPAGDGARTGERDAPAGERANPAPRAATTGMVVSPALAAPQQMPGGAHQNDARTTLEVPRAPASTAASARGSAPAVPAASRPQRAGATSSGGPSAAAVRAAQPPARQAAARTGSDGRVPPAPVTYRGALAIESSPEGASVFVNRRAVGSTPLLLEDLPIGSHAVRIEADGYQLWSAAVRVVADRRTQVTAQLHPTSNR